MKKPSLNKVLLIGEVAYPPDLSYTLSGIGILKFQIKVERTHATKEGKVEVTHDYFPILAWGGMAEKMNNILKKGDMIFIEGKIRIRSYKKKTGEIKTILEIVANDIQPLIFENERKENVDGIQ